MRLTLLTIFLAITAVGYFQQAVFYCPRKIIKLPKTEEGKSLTWAYHIENKGQIPLEIYNADVECSCTEVFLSKSKLLPGETAEIRVTFNTMGRPFYQDRKIKLTTNSKKKLVYLRFKVYVIPTQVG